VSFAAITLCVASQRVSFCCKRVFLYRFSPETFGFTLILCFKKSRKQSLTPDENVLSTACDLQ
jgi:hypothetical protein